MIRSRSRWNSERPIGAGSANCRPRETVGSQAYGASSCTCCRLFQYLAYDSYINVRCDESLAQSTQQYQSQSASFYLLVTAHQVQVTLGPERRCFYRKTGSRENSNGSLHI